MGTVIIILCCLVFLSWYGILIRLSYVLFGKKKALWLNTEVIVKKAPRILFACFKKYLGFKFEGDYSNIDKIPEQCLLISNHQSILDIVVFMRYYSPSRLRFIAKKELGTAVPLISLMLKTADHCLVSRKGSPSESMKAVDKFAEHVKKNNLLPVIFPEGTRSKTGALGSFHTAGFRRFLNNTPMPVAVFALDGGWNISSVRKITQNLRGASYKIKFLKVYDAPTTKEEQMKILTEAKELIQAQLDSWRSF